MIFWITGWLFTLGWFEYENCKEFPDGRMPFIVFAIGAFLLIIFWPYSIGKIVYQNLNK
jgi:hypothetical protein